LRLKILKKVKNSELFNSEFTGSYKKKCRKSDHTNKNITLSIFQSGLTRQSVNDGK